MEDHRDPFYTPFGKPSLLAPRTLGEEIWTWRKDRVTWSCELRFHGESYGWQAMIFRDGELTISHRFILRESAIRWSKEQHSDIERGWIDE